MDQSVSKINYTLQLKEDILITTLMGTIKMDIVLKLLADMQKMVIESNGLINKLVSDARQMDALQTMPRDYDIFPQISKGMEEKKIISESARHAFIVSHEDHHLAAQLLGMTFQKCGISHELKPFKSLEAATVWLDLPVADYIPQDTIPRRRPSESSSLSLFGGSLSM